MAQQEQMYQTMSLGTMGPSTITEPLLGARANLNVESRTNRTDDIRGAKPEIIQHRYLKNRPDLYNNADVRGARSTRLHPVAPNKTIGLNLTNRDIARTTSQANNFVTTRMIDPLVPNYTLPSCPSDAPVREQLVDTNKLSDIEKSAPRPLFPWEQRETHGADDITGASRVGSPGTSAAAIGQRARRCVSRTSTWRGSNPGASPTTLIPGTVSTE